MGCYPTLLSQLTEQGLQDKYEEVLAEVPKGCVPTLIPPLVTPLSQMVVTQALMNVISGKRYKLVPTEIKDYVRGLYGRPPASFKNGDPRKKSLGQKVITERPADLIPPQLPEFEQEIKEYAKTEEDVLMHDFPQPANISGKTRRSVL